MSLSRAPSPTIPGYNRRNLIGTTLSHFRITAKLGEGGMGEVYRAEDTKLGREVAIKVLPEAVAEDPERLARFEREAKVLAALNHPHIAGIYSLESEEDINFLVMELVEGEDLSEILDRGATRLEVALPIALQIAQALEVAHEGGIVHRDLKPANIKVSPDGQVKVLDFGLAKALDPGGNGSGRSGAELSMSPTLTAQMTQAGVILGTAAYMSPEQARGQEADHRSDIWSFGLVCFEMVSGQQLFDADTVSDTLARVLMQEPDWQALEGKVPAPVLALLRRCLERDVRQRLQAVGEARIALEGFVSDPESLEAQPAAVASASPDRPSRPWRLIGGLVAGLLLGWLGSMLIGSRSEVTPPAESWRFAIHPVEGHLVGNEDANGLDLSRDGRKVVFVGTAIEEAGTMLYLKTSQDAEPRPLPGTEGGRAPFFSPDGEWVAYFSDRDLFKISLQGGSPMVLTSAGDRRGGFWHPDGTIYFVPHSDGPVMKISSGGGEVTPVSTLDEARRERTHRWPALVPGGRALLYTSDTFDSTEYYDDARIEALDLETGEAKVVLEGASRAVALSSGHLVYARDGSLFAVPFDLERLEMTGSPRLALQGVLTVVASGAVQFAVSDLGSMAYVPGGKTTEVFDMVWLGRDSEMETVSAELGNYAQVALSPAGDRAALATSGQDSQDLWIFDMARETVSRFTFEASNADPLWTPDGQQIIFASSRDDSHPRPYVKSADGTGQATLIWDAPAEAYPMDITADGRYLAVEVRQAEGAEDGATDIWIVDMTGESEPYPLIEDRFYSAYVEFSPDDRWIAYISSESGQDEVFVRPFPAADGKWQISQGLAREPRWSPDGKTLFFRTREGHKFVSIDTSEGFRAGRPELLAAGNLGAPFNTTYSVSPDGERLLSLRPHLDDQSVWRIHVIQGWQNELERESQ